MFENLNALNIQKTQPMQSLCTSKYATQKIKAKIINHYIGIEIVYVSKYLILTTNSSS